MPEAAAGGPLAVVREGEIIRIDVPARRIDLNASDLEERVSGWKPPVRDLRPGWLSIYSEIVQPIQRGAVLGKRRNPSERHE
jgi:dihydroxy-acid dehydratase